MQVLMAIQGTYIYTIHLYELSISKYNVDNKHERLHEILYVRTYLPTPPSLKYSNYHKNGTSVEFHGVLMSIQMFTMLHVNVLTHIT